MSFRLTPILMTLDELELL